jgi:hypothetical protein
MLHRVDQGFQTRGRRSLLISDIVTLYDEKVVPYRKKHVLLMSSVFGGRLTVAVTNSSA